MLSDCYLSPSKGLQPPWPPQESAPAGPVQRCSAISAPGTQAQGAVFPPCAPPVPWLCLPHGNNHLISFHQPPAVSYPPLCCPWLLGLQRVRAGHGDPGAGRAPASAAAKFWVRCQRWLFRAALWGAAGCLPFCPSLQRLNLVTKRDHDVLHHAHPLFLPLTLWFSFAGSVVKAAGT